ncbi:hypothetical protein LRAMOSA05320 [Lichtheimia ramosa]|uniref:Secreted protein n=1 Tax=Lichtheimia ramosa TaxID=688394 RepID=A0A077X282_9FUNG|nr:hypothetical protein LRAMOSA05320 [Lichtheimia ramosa]
MISRAVAISLSLFFLHTHIAMSDDLQGIDDDLLAAAVEQAEIQAAKRHEEQQEQQPIVIDADDDEFDDLDTDCLILVTETA